MVKLKFYISSAGVAGDPYKLLVACDENGDKLGNILFKDDSLLSLRWNKRKLMKKIELTTGQKTIEV